MTFDLSEESFFIIERECLSDRCSCGVVMNEFFQGFVFPSNGKTKINP